MQKLSSTALLVAGLSQVSEAYKVRRWADMFKKKPLSEQIVNDLQRKYDIIYTLGFNSLVEADNTDAFNV